MIRVFKDVELDPEGVTSIWRWTCNDCPQFDIRALYWETAINSATRHYNSWHAKVNNA